MIIRKIRKNGIVSAARLIKRGCVLLVIFLLYKWGVYVLNNRNEASTTSIKPLQIGTSVTIQWFLRADNNFPHYTHSIVDEKKDTIGLKSTAVNLNTYSGKVEVVGTVEKFLKYTPILEVTAIKLPKQKLIIKNNTYFFADNFFLLDFSAQPQLSATRSWNDMLVLFEDKEVVSIERFFCGKILKGKTCDALISDYSRNQKDNFYSLRGYSFYKHSSGAWVVFEGDTFGYIFKNIDDDMMLNLSSMVRMVNKEFVVENKLPVIQDTCASADEYLKKIISSQIKYSSNMMVTLTLRGTTDRKNTFDCMISFDVWNQRAAKKISFLPTEDN